MRVLVGCEFSGIVREAFRVQGWDAWSCDLLPTEQPGQHYQCDVREVLSMGWDLMIAHPPCTYLTAAGNRWFKPEYADVYPTRRQDREEAIALVRMLWNAPIERIAVENPIGTLSSRFRPPSQIIQPWQFGHGETKATCLWLRELPLLRATNVVSGRVPRIHWLGRSKNRSKLRSLTYQGIADAMAAQWGTEAGLMSDLPLFEGGYYASKMS